MRPALALLLVLAACTSPRGSCVERANARLDVLDADITATELALERGYRQAPRSPVYGGLSFCAGNDVSLCLGSSRVIGGQNSAIDPVTERSRLRTLRAQRPAVLDEAVRNAAACPAR